MFALTHTQGSVLCCKCGIPIYPNAANMCVKCARSEVDITEGLLKSVTIIKCGECGKYLQPPKTWVLARPESPELLTFCIKRLNLEKAKVRLAHADWVWTEPHSKRVKIKLKIRKEVMSGLVLEQAYIVDYVVQDHNCDSCTRVLANPDQWVASVQVRQHVPHMRTFLYLEQVILKHGAVTQAIRVKQQTGGVDFFFANRSHAVRFVDFVGKVVPIKSRSDKELVSQDSKNNSYNYKYTFSVDIVPICREDLICLPQKLSTSLGNLGPLVICTKMTNTIQLLDPNTLRHGFLTGDQYWRSKFECLLSSRRLVKYIVLDIDNVSAEVNVAGMRYAMADAQVARVSDFGCNDTMFTIRTHLGHVLSPGDFALGYDLYGANLSSSELDKYRNLVLPYAILIKKCFEHKFQKKRVAEPDSGEDEPGDSGEDEPDIGENEIIDDDEYELFVQGVEKMNLSLNATLHERIGDLSLRDRDEHDAMSE